MGREVERKKKNGMKVKERKMRRKRKMGETAQKMKNMIGLGPVTNDSVEHFNRRVKDLKLARRMAVEEYLNHFLDFNEEEISELDIVETKHSKDNVMYIALSNIEHIREIRFRRAACGNDALVMRDFIPPQYHERYMAVAKKAAENRAVEKMLKTQIRWGDKDVEIFTKKKGNDELFSKVDLMEFMGGSSLPEYDMSIKWTMRKEGLPRRKLEFERKAGAPPSSRKNKSFQMEAEEHTENTRPMTRKHSTGRREEEAKKRREQSTECGDSDMDQFETPAKEKNSASQEKENCDESI